MIKNFFWYNTDESAFHYTKILGNIGDLFKVVEFTLYGDSIYENDTTYSTKILNKQKRMEITNLTFIRAVIGNLFTAKKFKYVYVYNADNATSADTIYER